MILERRTTWCLGILLCVHSSIGLCQTTQAVIAGRIINSLTGNPVAGAQISTFPSDGEPERMASSSPDGYFVIPLLSPGMYRVRVEAANYQDQELFELELPVSSRMELNFLLRPINDVWELGRYRSVFLPKSNLVLRLYGPDVDSNYLSFFDSEHGTKMDLQFSISSVIDRFELDNLPLAGRDTYALLLIQAGVGADTGTARGLGLAVNGQRPAASNYLLDGLENNNHLTTGPLYAISPEAVQDYRMSTSNFTAEYGGTSGFLANMASRAGSNEWHSLLYYHLKNSFLNANGFQQNFEGFEKPPIRESQTGFTVGGPLLSKRLFGSLAFEWYGFGSRSDPQIFNLPTAQFIAMLTPGSAAKRLFDQFPTPLSGPANSPVASVSIAPPSSLQRLLALPRADYVTGSGKNRFMSRVAISRMEEPDFVWSPYPDFIAPLHQNASNAGGSWISNFTPTLTGELRAGWSTDDLRFNRPHLEIPTLVVGGTNAPVLPGSSMYYSYLNHGNSFEVNQTLTWTAGRHMVKAGGGALVRTISGYLTAGRDGYYSFPSTAAFLMDQPSTFIGSATRSSLPTLQSPSYDREYRYLQFSGFVQDDFRVLPRLVLNLGLRYENFGAPVNTGTAKDALLHFGTGATFLDRLSTAAFSPLPQSGSQQLYDADNRDFSVRFGFAYQLPATSQTVLRGGYGIYYDRPFDNLWQTLRNNNIALATAFPRSPFDYLQPLTDVFSQLHPSADTSGFPQPTIFQPGLRNGYAQDLALALDHQWSRFDIAIAGTSSLDRRLITTDVINRQSVSLGRIYVKPNQNLSELSYRANQGISDYYALAVTGRYRATHAFFQTAYTWSHTIDEQSDPLTGDFFDLQFADFLNHPPSLANRGFTAQFDNRGDRANSDFDQRQNLVLSSVWDVPAPDAALLRGWKLAGLAAFRSGLPYSVTVAERFDGLEPELATYRASIVDPAHLYVSSPAPGGVQVLNPAALAIPALGTQGNSGRNAFRGPGLYNIDLSLSRTVRLGWPNETAAVTLRADAYNVLNHANLNQPCAFLNSASSCTFGVAQFGRQGVSSGFPAVSPVNDTPRQIQLMVRLQF